MKNKVILIIGSSGMAGHMISEYLDSLNIYTILRIARDHNSKNHYNIDVTNFEQIEKLVYKLKPDYIINAIGVLNQFAEKSPEKAILINSYFPHFLAKICINSKSTLIHISTDCVFSGKKGFYIESDIKDGVGFYAQSKSLGEVVYNNHITIRTSIIGPELKTDGIGLLNWILHQQFKITGFSEVFWGGVTTLELAKYIHHIISRKNGELNLVHLTNNIKISKYDLINIVNNTFKLQLEISSTNSYKSDKSIINTNNIFNYDVPSYFTMIDELYNWMHDHKQLYKNYTLN